MDIPCDRSVGMGKATRGEPTTLRRIWISGVRPEREAAQGGQPSQEETTCRGLAAPLLAMAAMISSGMGTSRTISRASSRSKFGQSFFIQGFAGNKDWSGFCHELRSPPTGTAAEGAGTLHGRIDSELLSGSLSLYLSISLAPITKDIFGVFIFYFSYLFLATE